MSPKSLADSTYISSKKRVYLDHAGATLPSSELLKSVAESLTITDLCLGNPHSRHYSGQSTTSLIENARNRILGYFGVSSSSYVVVFTANATAALKLVAENFNFGSTSGSKDFRVSENLVEEIHGTEYPSTLMMLRDSHTSVVGMRNVASCQKVLVVKHIEELETFLSNNEQPLHNGQNYGGFHNNLFVMTAMSNFCGRKYDLSVIERLRTVSGAQWSICLDASALAGSSQLNLTLCGNPDFVACSFYKMFGYPTGLGALLIRRDRASLLKKSYFGGGSVNFVSDSSFFVEYRDEISDRFEDGTLDYYSISALRFGFEDLLRFGGISGIEKHCWSLARKAWQFLSNAKHANGMPVAIIYGNGWNQSEYPDCKKQGPIINFNLLRDDASFVGYSEVDKMSDLFGIELRTGCFCNQGACAMHLKLDEQSLNKSHKDVRIFQQMIECCFISYSPNTLLNNSFSLNSIYSAATKQFPVVGLARLTHIFVYPIKSCGSHAPNRQEHHSLRNDIHRFVRYLQRKFRSMRRGKLLCYMTDMVCKSHWKYLVRIRRTDVR
ncbi:aminotransferase class-V domain-containing protein [Ditylenchus destructor]|uniref:Aminotransferase class-V domain-containing protein n=1 Tax=Ditylenchus destructor TaxID=166010 RepID=A0AAD4R359_9BILA|nr:aminotransferase class-V domain-containing protein [Ditylenchus destructor]